MDLLMLLQTDIVDFLDGNRKLIFNERDLQVQLAIHLTQCKHYHNVYTEYAVPLQTLNNLDFDTPKYSDREWTSTPKFPWHNQMYIDIVVEKEGKFAAVELKYATTQIKDSLQVFNTQTPPDIDIIKHQGATDLVMYNYWKDVRRIEAITTFPDVVGGIALIISNNHKFWVKPTLSTAIHAAFSMHEGNKVGGELLKWREDTSKYIVNSHPDFYLEGSYPCHWEDTNIAALSRKKGLPFRYMISLVPSKNTSLQ